MKQASRNTYRKEHPLPPGKLAGGLLSDGVRKEVTTEEMEHPMYAEVYTIPEAARALGRSELCLKRWITDGIVPEPILRDTTRNYRHYSAGELRTIARVLSEHEEEFKYLTVKHTSTIHTLWQAVQGYRASRI